MAEQVDTTDCVSDALDDKALHALRQRLAPALVDMQRRGETSVMPEMRQDDVAFYTDPARFERERQAYFRDMPLVACLSAELPEAGSFRTFDDAGVPMLLTRGKDGKVRAFLNVCPHRGARIVREPCGKAGRFTCRFHGWTYDAEGQAIGIPEEKLFCGGAELPRSLHECPAEERHGLVFVRTVPGSAIDLDSHLAGIGDDLAALRLETAEVVHSDTLQVDANWKYGLDTFFETYHLNSLHRETFRGLFSPVNVFDTFGPHHRYTFAPLGLADWPDMRPEDRNVDLIPLQYFLFPNTILSVGSTSARGSVVNMHQILPASVDHFASRLSYCLLGGVRSPEDRAEVDRAYAITRQALVDEDYSVVNESFRGFAALPPGTQLPTGRQETGVQNFHANVIALSGG